MKKMIVVMLALLLVGCSAGNSSSEGSQATESNHQEVSMDSASEEQAESEATEKNAAISQSEGKATERMVAYESYVDVSVNNVEEVAQRIEERVKGAGGYIVESSITSEGDQKRAHLSVRVPSQGFESFLQYIEKTSEKVENRNVRGEDVTEEYVDLAARLKAKRTVEERLLDFMKDAQKTEDLLKISNDLAGVQEEIERVEGRMKYLKGRTDYALVNLTMQDVNVSVPKVKGSEDLQTGEKIKQAFMSSLNGIAVFFSAIAVFLIGFSPILLLVAGIAIAGFVVYKKKLKGQNKRPSE